MTSTAAELIDVDVIVRLVREHAQNGWRYTTNIDDVPEAAGHYGLQDGLDGKGGGVTLNMRKSIESSYWFRQMKRPIFSWLPEIDGDATLWLDGKIRCSRCADKPIISLDDIDEHGVKVHGDERECHCD